MAIWIVGAERFAVERFGVGKGGGARVVRVLVRVFLFFFVSEKLGLAKAGTVFKKLEGINTNLEAEKVWL